MDLSQIQKTFESYIKTFDNKKYDISYKIKHSYRVMELSNELARKLNLTKDEINLAIVIGLLHDIGRFKQLETFNSYDDCNVDHGDLGAKVLFENGFINRFAIERKYYEIIKFAIINHNKLRISDTDNDKEMFFAKIIRDTDKIDILRAFSIYNDYKIETDDSLISKNVSNSFFNKKEIIKADIKTKNDLMILRLGLIHDINFDESIKIINNDKIINIFEEQTKDSEILKPYLKHTKQYIKERIR